MGDGILSSRGRPEHSDRTRPRCPHSAMGHRYRGGPWGFMRGGVDRPEHRFAWPWWRPSSWLAWWWEIGWPTTRPLRRAQVSRLTIHPHTKKRRRCRTRTRSSQRIFPTRMSCGRAPNTWRQQRAHPRSTFSSPHPAISFSGRPDPTCSPSFRPGPSTGSETCGHRIWNTRGDRGSSGSRRRGRAENSASGGRRADQSPDRS